MMFSFSADTAPKLAVALSLASTGFFGHFLIEYYLDQRTTVRQVIQLNAERDIHESRVEELENQQIELRGLIYIPCKKPNDHRCMAAEERLQRQRKIVAEHETVSHASKVRLRDIEVEYGRLKAKYFHVSNEEWHIQLLIATGLLCSVLTLGASIQKWRGTRRESKTALPKLDEA